MNRIMALLAVLVMTIAAAPAAFAAAPSDVRIDVGVILSGNLSSSTTHGTFSLNGLATDAGTEAGAGWFAGEGHLKSGEPNSLHAEMTLTGAHGSIMISLRGLFGTLPAASAEGQGRWVITDGTGAYENLHGEGSWTAVADFRAAIAHIGPPRVGFTLVGSAH